MNLDCDGVRMNSYYKDAIIKFMSEKLGAPVSENEIEWDENFIEVGYLDSLDIYRLLMFLEKQLKTDLDISALIEDFPVSFKSLYSKIYFG